MDRQTAFLCGIAFSYGANYGLSLPSNLAEDKKVFRAQFFDPKLHPRGRNGRFIVARSGRQGGLGDFDPKQYRQAWGEQIYLLNGEDPVKKLISLKRGHIKNAFHNRIIGNIDLVWGNGTIGLSHLIDRRKKEKNGDEAAHRVVDNIGKVLRNGKTYWNPQQKKWEVWYDGMICVVRGRLHGNTVRYVVTAYVSSKMPKRIKQFGH